MVSKYIWIGACLTILGGALFAYTQKQPEKQAYTIGIIQTATHPALDELRESFVSEITRLSQGSVRFVTQNAEGSLSQAQSIAESFHTHKKIDAILAIGTPAVQAIARVEKQKPIVIAAVSDPFSLGIIHPGTNICGTTDQVNTETQADLIVKVIPTARTVVIVYNPSENNSVVMVEKMEHSLQKRGLHAVKMGVHVESEIAQAIGSAAHKGDVILIPADNLLVGAMPLVAKEALKEKCPLWVSDIPSVTKGALIAEGADYSDLGKSTAQLAHKVSQGEKPEVVGIVHPTNMKIVVNKKTLDALHITLPKDLSSSVILIEDEGGAHAS